MTVSYNAEVATSKGFGCFIKLLKRWRGSIYKVIWIDLCIFLLLYYILNLIYYFLLSDLQKLVFESIVTYFNTNIQLIPISFVLGFYIKIVMARWWEQYMSLPWPDPIAVYVTALIKGQDEHGRLMRRTIMRYVCLCFTMVSTLISPGVKKRFPTLDQLVDAGLLVDSERSILKSMDVRFPKHHKYWMPIVWASCIVTRARKEGRLRDDHALKTIIDALNSFRGNCITLINYNIMSIPLVYTQVVSLAVYSYFLSAVIAKQWTETTHSTGFTYSENYFPVFTTLEFVFYMGLLKAAESVIWPFGEDDDDFDLNAIIDRNLSASYLIVDEMHSHHPELMKDQYWNEVLPNDLYYPSDTQIGRELPPEHSTARLGFSKNSKTMLFWKRSTFGSTSVQNSISRITRKLIHFKSFDDTTDSRTRIQSYSSSNSSTDESVGFEDILYSILPGYNDIISSSEYIHDSYSPTISQEGEFKNDDFEILRSERQRKRIERQKQKISFSVNVDHITDMIPSQATNTHIQNHQGSPSKESDLPEDDNNNEKEENL